MKLLAIIFLLVATPAYAVDCVGGRLVDGPNGPQCVPLTQSEIDQRAADAIADEARQAAVAAEKQRQNSLKAESDVIDLANRLKTATPSQIDTWVNNNVTDLNSARNTLKAIIKLLAYALRDA